MMEVDNVKEWELDWIDVHDLKVCPNCQKIRLLKERTIDQWARVGLPGAGHTICKGRCRCMLLPHELAELFPKMHGQGISLRGKDAENLRIAKEVDYKKANKLDWLIDEWEGLTDDWNLPLSYYDLFELDERLDFLEKIIQHFKNKDFPEELLESLKKQNPWIDNPERSNA